MTEIYNKVLILYQEAQHQIKNQIWAQIENDVIYQVQEHVENQILRQNVGRLWFGVLGHAERQVQKRLK